MSKRHHRGESDNFEATSHARSSAKRARTGSSDDERDDSPQPQAGPSRDARAGNRRNNSRAADRDEDVNMDDMEIDDEEEHQPVIEQVDEEEFERVQGEILRKHLAKREKVQGGIAEYGIVEHVDMTQFMCHKNLSFNFGPQINFLIGHNGSGKSAVLSAITIALGGKAISTGRGNGLKSFIREGQAVAEVTIHLKNQGDEAYRPQDYGKTIIITRRFTKDGSSTWKIKSKDGKVISSKKDELAAICDHMNIQVDNPMNVLTQDAARQFLSASKPEDKYQFFLRGTQLTQLSDEYQICLDNISLTNKMLVAKKAAIPDLVERRNLINAKYEEANKAREQKEKIQEMMKELAWAHVATKEDELTKAMAEVAKAEKKLPKIEESIQQKELIIEKATAEVTEYEKESQALDDIHDLDEQKEALHAEMRANKTELAALIRELRDMNMSVAQLNRTIEEFDRSLEIEAQKTEMRNRSQGTQAKIAEGKELVTRLETRMNELMAQRKALSVEADNIRLEGKGPEGTMEDCQRVIQENDSNIAAARQRENDVYTPYGTNIKQVLEKVHRSSWHGETPLGPLGLYVTVKDAQSWGNILRRQLANSLVSWAVTDPKDIRQLKQIFNESRNNHMNVVTSPRDLFNFERGEPPSHVLTVLRALNISDPFVLRILVNQLGIESRVLSPRRADAQHLLQSLGGGRAWSADGMAVQVFPEGGVSSVPVDNRPMSGSASQLLTGRDAASDIAAYEQAKVQAQQRYQEAWNECEALKRQYVAKKQVIDALNAEEPGLQKQLRDAKIRLNSLEEEANAELPANVAGMKEGKKEAEDEKALLLVQVEQVMTSKAAVDATQNRLQTQLNQIRDKEKGRQDERNVISTKIDALVEKSVKAQHDLKHYQAKHKEAEEAVRMTQTALTVVESEFKDWTTEAQKISMEPYPNPRKPDTVQRSIDSMRKALAERAKISGASVDVLIKQLNAAEDNLSNAQTELRQMIALTKALKASVIFRLHRWEEFRRHIALRCKQIFQTHLSMRGYYGKIMFDHTKQLLELRVKTDDQTQTQGSGDKDPKSLSGGEKSFSTICLLLSLWECIGCPVRCLDEFDVFMDAVNRRISMKMMIETAKMSDKKQYILITPQDMSSVMITDSVRVLRMPDPERGGNATLPFVSANSS